MPSPDSNMLDGPDGGRVAVLGLNHATAPLAIREAIAFTETEVPPALERLTVHPMVSEAVLLSTCNRTEVYIVSAQPQQALVHAAEALDGVKSATVLRDEDITYRHTDAAAIEHLYTVAGGLDSLMVGETQILTQVKSAYDMASAAGAVGMILNRLFQSALHVGKRARNETEIGIGAVSVSSAAVGLAEKVFGDLSERTALLVGAGESGRLAAEHLSERGIGRLIISNRTMEKAERLASAVGGMVIPFESRGTVLSDVDVLVSVTSSPVPLFTGAEIGKAMRSRPRRPLLAIDLAVPRDIDPDVNRFENVFLYDVDALEVMVEQTLSRRRKEIPLVEGIVEHEQAEFLAWYESLAVTPLIQQLLMSVEQIRREQLERYGHQFTESDRERLDQFTRTLMNKILHQPLTRMRAFSRDSRWGAVRLDTVRELFGLEDTNGQSSNQDRDAR